MRSAAWTLAAVLLIAILVSWRNSISPRSDGLPQRVWWRSDGRPIGASGPARPYVFSDRPGGHTLSGTWAPMFGCSQDSWPGEVWLYDFDAHELLAVYRCKGLREERDGYTWWLATRETD